MGLLHHLSKTKDMNNDITTEERIDNYLLGRMSEAERVAFEKDLATDEELKEEYECQKAVANAVQKVAIKDFLTRHAAERQEERSNVIDLSTYFKQATGKIREFFSSGQRVAWTLASVAAMVVAIVVGVNYTSTLHTMQSNGMLAYTELTVPVSRDGNEFDALIEKAYTLIGAGNFDTALDTIRSAKAMANEGLEAPVVTEEDEYEHQVLQQKLYDLEWYEAIVLMRQGKVIKAKKMLKSIALSSSPYAEVARDELKSLF